MYDGYPTPCLEKLTQKILRKKKKCMENTTAEPHHKKVGYMTKPSYNKVILLVPALYTCISLSSSRGIMTSLI